ncbi:MAG: hypothetical protein ACRDP3_18160 [Streptomyces sp.]|uniref:hypothetical protein n=1 Tax=Streptomyces sp. TaxID=1931 RepID=UPI003D6A4A25
MDAETISARISAISVDDSRELDHACETLAGELERAGTEPPFDLNSADFAGDPYLITADRYWRLRFLDRPSIRTAGECARWLYAHLPEENGTRDVSVRTAIEEKWALGYAFVTKDSVESRADLDSATTDLVGSADISYFATLYHAGKLRSNFAFDELHRFVESSLIAAAAGPYREQPVFQALQAFAAYGSRAITTERARQLLDDAWLDHRRTRATVDICLNALYAATPFEGHGETLRERAEEAVREWPRDHLFRYRLARGQQMCGRLDAALESVDRALSLLPAHGNRGSHKLLQEQYLGRREAILDGRIQAGRHEEQRRQWDRQNAHNQDLARRLESSTFTTVSVVTLFIAAVSFVISSVQLTFAGRLPLTDRAILMAELAGGQLLFAALIIGCTRLLTRPGRGSPGRER